jgi:hypothetical protein
MQSLIFSLSGLIKQFCRPPGPLKGVLEFFSAKRDYAEGSDPTSHLEDNKNKPLFTVISVLFSIIRIRNW